MEKINHFSKASHSNTEAETNAQVIKKVTYGALENVGFAHEPPDKMMTSPY